MGRKGVSKRKPTLLLGSLPVTVSPDGKREPTLMKYKN